MGRTSADPGDRIRALAWHLLEADWAPRLGPQGWQRLLERSGAGAPASSEPFETLPLAPFAAALEALPDPRDAGRLLALRWAATYRTLARRTAGRPALMLEVYCAEVHPWMLAQPGSGRVVDAGPSGAIVELGGALPPAFLEGLLAGLAEAAGAPGARVTRRGEHLAIAWERALAEQARPGRLALLARAVRAPMLAATLVPVVVGAALAWSEGFLDPGYAALTLLGVALLHLGSNAANDYFDHRSRADDENLTPTRFKGGSRVIQSGLLAPRDVLRLAVALYAAGAAVGLAIALGLQATRGAGLLEVAGLGTAGFLVGFLYTAPPARLSHRGLGELAAGLGFGPMLVAGTYLVQRIAAGAAPALGPAVLLYGLPVGALVAAMLTLHEVPAAPWDAKAGKRTLAVRLGPRRAVWGYGALLALAYAGIAAGALLLGPLEALLAFLTLPLALRAWRRALRDHAQPYRLAPASAAAALLHLTTGLLLSGGLLLARVLARGA